MLKVIHGFKHMNISSNEIAANTLNIQIRWRRKPRWIPTAKSKIFKVPPRPIIPVEEADELKRLSNNYRTQIKSIRRYLTYRYGASFQASADPETQKQIFEEDLARCMAINDKWNAQQKILREESVAKRVQEEIEFAKNRILEEEKKKELQIKEADEFVAKLKEEAKTFITAENIDAAIEEAIANPFDYNYAIDNDGNKILGRDTKAEIVKEKKALAQ